MSTVTTVHKENKKVLLRHTARRIASTRSAVLSWRGNTPVLARGRGYLSPVPAGEGVLQSWPGGTGDTPVLSQPGEYPSPGQGVPQTYPGQGIPLSWVPPGQDWGTPAWHWSTPSWDRTGTHPPARTGVPPRMDMGPET